LDRVHDLLGKIAELGVRGLGLQRQLLECGVGAATVLSHNDSLRLLDDRTRLDGSLQLVGQVNGAGVWRSVGERNLLLTMGLRRFRR